MECRSLFVVVISVPHIYRAEQQCFYPWLRSGCAARRAEHPDVPGLTREFARLEGEGGQSSFGPSCTFQAVSALVVPQGELFTHYPVNRMTLPDCCHP